MGRANGKASKVLGRWCSVGTVQRLTELAGETSFFQKGATLPWTLLARSAYKEAKGNKGHRPRLSRPVGQLPSQPPNSASENGESFVASSLTGRSQGAIALTGACAPGAGFFLADAHKVKFKVETFL